MVDKSIVIVGAGLAGISCAWALLEAGVAPERICILDKSAGVGGRMSTRRSEWGDFDHGAQYFTIRDPRFADWLKPWQARELVLPWHAKISVFEADGSQRIADASERTQQRHLAVPGMSAIAKAAAVDLRARGVEIRSACLVDVLQYVRAANPQKTSELGYWRLHLKAQNTRTASPQTTSSSLTVDSLVLAVPAPQALALLRPFRLEQSSVSSAIDFANVAMEPCWATMASLQFRAELPEFDAAFVNRGPLRWIACNSAKPGRQPPSGPVQNWVLHASSVWSQQNLEQPEQLVQTALLEALGALLPPFSVVNCCSHRWRYALGGHLPEAQTHCFFDPEMRLGLAGDWCMGGRIEAAFLSGQALAHSILA